MLFLLARLEGWLGLVGNLIGSLHLKSASFRSQVARLPQSNLTYVFL